MNMQPRPEMMTTAEVAEYLRLGERKIYDRTPCLETAASIATACRCTA